MLYNIYIWTYSTAKNLDSSQ